MSKGVIRIGKLTIGIRGEGIFSSSGKNYIIPKYYISPKTNHHSYKFYIRWLNFFCIMPRKCDNCKNYITNSGTHIWNIEGNKILTTICRSCKENKEYTNSSGSKITGYTAWLAELWDKDEKELRRKYNA